MKCYNCDAVITSHTKCNNCNTKIEREDYDLPNTKKILKKIDNITNFANFIGLFYVKSIYLLIVSIISIVVAFYFLLILKQNVVYIVFALIFVFSFNYFLEMKKIETFYKDFLNGDNHYYILWPLKAEYRTFFTDANENIPTRSILHKRVNAFNQRGRKVRFLRFNSYKFLHPQKPKLFMTRKQFFTKFFPEEQKHYIQTNNYDDESYVAVEGTVHGFLVMKNTVITLFNIPKLTKQMLKADELKELEPPKMTKEKKDKKNA